MHKLTDIIKLLRVNHWVKNAFIFFPLIFSGKFFQPHAFVPVFIAFTGFCLTASGLYVLNDYLDRERDALHPRKSARVMNKNNLDTPTVTILIIGLLSIGLAICWQANILVFGMACVYILLHLGYNFCVKNIVLLDVIFVALGFHIRIWTGGAAAEALPSVWLQLCVFLLALFLGFTKRRAEITVLGEKAAQHRSVLAHYNVYLLDQIILVCSTLAIVFYGLYTISDDIYRRLGSYNMTYSLVFVIYGMFRYLYIIHMHKKGDDPGEILMTDSPLLLNVVLWILFIAMMLYTTV